jgi:hypothetical protein
MARPPLGLVSRAPAGANPGAGAGTARIRVTVQTSGSRLSDAMLRAVVWGFVGGLFGVLFVVAHDAVAPWLPVLDPLLLAAALAGAVGAVVYSSMRLTLLAAGACALMFALVELASVALRARVGELWIPELLVGGAVAVGAVAGAYYGCSYRQSRIYRALPKTLAGLVAGLLVGVGWWLLRQVVGEVPLAVSIAVLCPLVGWSYVGLAGILVRAWGDRLAPTLDAALVGAAVSGLVALGFWATAGMLQPDMAGGAGQSIRAAVDQVPVALLAGWLGGMVAGFTRGILGFGWYDL